MKSNNPIAPAGDNVNAALNTAEDAQPGGTMNAAKSGGIWLNLVAATGSVTLSSKGGNGGKGQTGADGQNGCDFPDEGWQTRFGNCQYLAESGGAGGKGGWGGDAGDIRLVFSRPDVINSISVDTSGGKQGDYGDIGKPGQHGGFGYKSFYTGQYDHHGEPIIAHTPIPPTGQAPDIANPINDNARAGKAGTVLYKSFDENYSLYIPVEFAQLLMLKVESLYLNNRGDLTECIQALNYLSQIAAGGGSGLTGATPADGCPSVYLDTYVTDKAAWDAIRMKTLSYLSQIDLGLDIFGNPFNYAPNMNPAFLQTGYAQVNGLIDGFEDFVIKLLDDQQELQITQNDRQVAVKQYDQLITAYQSQIDECKAQILTLYAEIQKRLSDTEDLKRNLLIDDFNFREAVRQQSSGCELADVIHFVTAVIAIGTAVYTLGTTAVATAGTVKTIISGVGAIDSFSDLKDALKSGGVISNGIKDIRKDIQTGEDQIKIIKDNYNDLAGAHDPVPSSLLALDKDNFDKTIDKFLNLPEAQKYKKDYHDFIDYVQLTNEKRQQLTSLVLKINTLYQSQQTAVSGQNIVKGAIDHVLDKAISFRAKQAITSLYYQTKWNVIRQIYLQDKAIAYQAPEASAVRRNYDDYNIKTLKADIFNINTQYINSLTGHQYQMGGSLNPYTLSLKNEIGSNPVTSAFLKSFLTGYVGDDGKKMYELNFNINTILLDTSDTASQQRIAYLKGIFSDIKNVKVIGVKAIFNSSADLDGEIVFRLTQMGNSTVTTAANFQTPVKFSHQKVIANPLKSVLKTNSAFTGFADNEKKNMCGIEPGSDKIYMAGVSPFASWKLEISEAVNPHLNLDEALSQLNSIDLYFWYYYENA